jgi:long-subunit acyl-CoA synthetase (AMP-forming)
MEKFSLNRLIHGLPDCKTTITCKSATGLKIISAAEMWTDIETVCAQMGAVGFGLTDKAILCGENSYELVVCDLACIVLGISTVHVPKGHHGEAARIASLMEATVIFTDEKIVLASTPVIAIDQLLIDKKPSWARPLQDLIRRNDVLVTYKSSSGTTEDRRKYVGCNSSHVENLVNQISEIFEFGEDDRLLFFLPLSVFLQRCLLYLALYRNTQICLTSFESSFFALRQFRPSVIFGVPSFYEALFRSKSILSAMFQKHPPHVLWSGSAGVNAQVAKYFADQGFPLYEGYGMTEIGLISKASPGRWRLGSVGKVLAGVDIKFDAERQILVKTQHAPEPKYIGDSGERSFAISPEGYFATGDLGFLDEDGFLFITGRIKNTIVLDSGNKVMPEGIERRVVSMSADIKNCIVVGDGKSFLSAIIEMSTAPMMAQSLLHLICAANSGLPEYQRIQRVALISDEWPGRSNCLTFNNKFSRKQALELYAEVVNNLYANDFSVRSQNGIYFSAVTEEIHVQ